MADSSNTSSSGGIGFAELLTVLFVGLKLTHYIDWAWYWILAPLWIGLAIELLICGAGLFGVLIVFLVGMVKKRRKPSKSRLSLRG